MHRWIYAGSTVSMVVMMVMADGDDGDDEIYDFD